MGQTVKHVYYSIFKVENGALKRADDFSNERDAHEHASKKEYEIYVVLPVHELEAMEYDAQLVGTKEVPAGGPIVRTKKKKEEKEPTK